jgi:hypothetical protein
VIENEPQPAVLLRNGKRFHRGEVLKPVDALADSIPTYPFPCTEKTQHSYIELARE